MLPQSPTAPLDEEARASAQAATLRVLFGSAVFMRAGLTLGFAVAVLLIEDMLGNKRWAGLSTVAITVGTVLSASLLNSYMNKRGRRPGLVLGYAIAAVGSGVALVGAQVQSISTFLIGLVLVGVGSGANNLARYAAADLALDENKAKAISFIVFAATIGAVGGPTLVGAADDVGQRLGLRENVGPNGLTALFFAVGAVIVFAGLRPDPLVLIGGLDASLETKRAGFAETMRMIRSVPMARLALWSLIVSQAVMVGVMAMTPLHMRAHGHDVGIIGLVISAHTAGMYAFAPLAGWLADKVGRIRSIVFGAAVLVLATTVTALAGDASRLLMFSGLYLLGLGWSFGMVAGSALLTESVHPDERVAAQGAADLMAGAVSGVAALGSGFVLDAAGFPVLSMIGITAAGILLVNGLFRDRTLVRVPDSIST